MRRFALLREVRERVSYRQGPGVVKSSVKRAVEENEGQKECYWQKKESGKRLVTVFLLLFLELGDKYYYYSCFIDEKTRAHGGAMPRPKPCSQDVAELGRDDRHGTPSLCAQPASGSVQIREN